MEFSSSSSSGSSKRARTAVRNINANVSCLVDGCNSDLSQCREYHRRHKVCTIHSKTSMVTIGGREQRFCQQCSRFHSLVEFDDGKRSCRKRLDGHNRRRRKPQSDSMSRTCGMFLPGQQGTTLLSFSSPQIDPTAVVSAAAWAAGPVKPEDESESMLFSSQRPINYMDEHNLFPESSAHSYKGVNQFPFLQGTDCIDLLEAATSAGGLTRAGNSDRALSLLSSAPAQSQTRDMASTQMVQPGPNSRAQTSLINNLEFTGLGQFPFTPEMESKDDSNANNNNTTLQFQGMFHDVPNGSSVAGAQQTLSFRWE